MTTNLKPDFPERQQNQNRVQGLILETYQPDEDNPYQGCISTSHGRSFKADLVARVKAQYRKGFDLSKPTLFTVYPKLCFEGGLILSVMRIGRPKNAQFNNKPDYFVEQTAELSHHQHLQTVNKTVPLHLVVENMLHALLDCIRQFMQTDTIALLLQTKSGQQLAVRATIGLKEEIVEEIRIPIGRGFAGQIAASCKLMVVDNLSKVEVVSPVLRNKGIRSMVGVPLLVKDQVIGVFHVGTFCSRQFTKDDAQLLQFIADRIGLAIEPLLGLWQLQA